MGGDVDVTLALHLGDCLDVLRTLPDCSVDAVVTDPPYGLAFMGKRWDYDVPTVEIWAECLRVLKPGGHLLAFAGTRTQHRMAVRIEDAGFEIRDMIAWVYGSGFPKSLDISKAIDKCGGDALAWRAFSQAYALAVSESPMNHADIDRALGVKSSSCYWARTDLRGGMPPRHHWEKLRELLALPAELERLYDEAEREVVGQKKTGDPVAWYAEAQRGNGIVDITAPATPEAQQWAGWGTALKPALEPITMARKPLGGTVAANVLTHGTGGINVDGCRVEGKWSTWRKSDGTVSEQNQDSYSVYGQGMGDVRNPEHPSGRWPANLITDGSDEVAGLFPLQQSGANPTRRGGMGYHGADGQDCCNAPRGADSGSAARFFYTAKASRDDRSDGNTHPTVKPTDLMRYLCRLVTPPGGIVLDPFMGSGSTGKAAMLEGFGFIGIEREAQYHAIAERRIRGAAAAGYQPSLLWSGP